jgi:hypothetical protein
MTSIDFKAIRKTAEQQGWQVDKMKSGHWKLVPPDETKPIVYMPGTASDWRSVHNCLSDMKKSGLVWP